MSEPTKDVQSKVHTNVYRDPWVSKGVTVPPTPAQKVLFDTGAERSADREHLDFTSIHPIAMIALARTYREGRKKYGQFNWEQGMAVDVALNHLLGHIFMYLAGDRSEPHLAHGLWNACVAVVSDTLWPHLNKEQRGPGCTLSPAIVETIRERKKADKIMRQAGVPDFEADNWTMAEVPEVAQILAARVTEPTKPDLRDGFKNS